MSTGVHSWHEQRVGRDHTDRHPGELYIRPELKTILSDDTRLTYEVVAVMLENLRKRGAT
jgi:hypothetical protein